MRELGHRIGRNWTRRAAAGNVAYVPFRSEAAMYARVARFEGGEAEALRRAAAEVNEMANEGPPRPASRRSGT